MKTSWSILAMRDYHIKEEEQREEEEYQHQLAKIRSMLGTKEENENHTN